MPVRSLCLRSPRSRRRSCRPAAHCASIHWSRCGQTRLDTSMQLTLRTCKVRSWRTSDAEPLTRAANNRKIWMNLRDAFPHPYTLKDAREYIRGVRQRTPETSFAIAVNDEAIGGVGFVLKPDVERVSAEIGYWLAEPFWGRGIASDALAAGAGYAGQTH